MGLPLKDAVRLASLNPAAAVGLDHKIGSLAPDKRADLIIMDEKVNIDLVMVAGHVMHRTDHAQYKVSG